MTRRSGIGIRRRAQACRERTPTATTTAATAMYRAFGPSGGPSFLAKWRLLSRPTVEDARGIGSVGDVVGEGHATARARAAAEKLETSTFKSQPVTRKGAACRDMRSLPSCAGGVVQGTWATPQGTRSCQAQALWILVRSVTHMEEVAVGLSDTFEFFGVMVRK